LAPLSQQVLQGLAGSPTLLQFTKSWHTMPINLQNYDKQYKELLSMFSAY